MTNGAVVVVGGTVGLGWGVARHYVEAGREVILTGRDEARANEIAAQLGGSARGAAFDLSEPQTIGPALARVGTVDRLVLAALDRDQNRVREYDVAAAIRLVTLKLVGYTEVVHALADRLHDDSSILLFGGLAKDKPYPGSTTITTINHGVDGLVRTLSVELAPIRVNAIHPGIVGDSPYWSGKTEALEAVKQRALTRRWVAMDDITAAAVLLLENPSIAATELRVDGGWGLPL
jgi:NAD(P)-dependent dehydrogenase (short-subunit alcohol dehydrogenase family)